MRFLNKIIFTINESFSGLWRNLYKSFIQLSIMCISLILLLYIFIFNININNTVRTISNKLEIVVFLDDNITDYDLGELINYVKNNKMVEKYSYTSKEDAKEKAMEMLNNDSSLNDIINKYGNPFPASIQISVLDANYIHTIVNELKNFRGIIPNGIKYGGEYVNKVIELNNTIKNISIAISIFLISVSIFLLISVIDLILSYKKNEYLIMTLVGASKMQVKMPYYIQGIFISLFSSLISYFVVQYSYIKFYSNSNILINLLGFVDFYKMQNDVLKLAIGIAIGLGFIATSISLNRFVKDKNTNNKRKVKTFSINKKENRIKRKAI